LGVPSIACPPAGEKGDTNKQGEKIFSCHCKKFYPKGEKSQRGKIYIFVFNNFFD
jgi:hypothetical protein